MRKPVISLMLAVVLLFGVMGAQEAYAQQQVVKVHVTVISICIEIPSPLDVYFGNVGVGTKSVASDSIPIKNCATSGDSITLELSCSKSNPDSWTPLAGAPLDSDSFHLNAMFNTTKPDSSAFNPVSHGVVETKYTCSAAWAAGDLTGHDILPGETRTMWLCFEAPTSDGGIPSSNPQDIELYIDGIIP